MKGFVGVFFIIMALLCMAGITTADIPNLVGNWTGPYTEYNSDSGFSGEKDGMFFLNITEQNDRIFIGFTRFTDGKDIDVQKDIAGVINAEGTGFSLAEQDNGYSTGIITGQDELELTYLNDRDPISVAIDTFTRIT